MRSGGDHDSLQRLGAVVGGRREQVWEPADELDDGRGDGPPHEIRYDDADERWDLEPDPDCRNPGWLDPAPPGPASGPGRWRATLDGLRWRITRRAAVALAVVGVLAATGACLGIWRDRPATQPVPPLTVASAAPTAAEPAGGPDAELASSAPTTPAPVSGHSADAGPGPAAAGASADVVVSVQGLVARPGLVHLDPGARVADALAAAGGVVADADLLGLNMAQHLSDGDQVLVGLKPAEGEQVQLRSGIVGGAAGGGSGGASGTAGKPSAGSGGKVDLNTATMDELDTLPGVGPATAQAILDWRSANGRFTSVEQLADVKGIGPAKLAKLTDHVKV